MADKHIHILLEPSSIQDLETIKQAKHISSNSHAIREALNYLARNLSIHISTPEIIKVGAEDHKERECAVRYKSARLCFRASTIEPLGMEDAFAIETSDGTFMMTKRVFYDAFPNVVQSASYRETKIYSYVTTPKKALRFKIDSDAENLDQSKENAMNSNPLCVKQYEYSRLCFKADEIEPLDWDEHFCIVTKEEVFMMTKREFYDTFSNVVKSESYLVRGIYHYPVTPKRAFQFRTLHPKTN